MEDADTSPERSEEEHRASYPPPQEGARRVHTGSFSPPKLARESRLAKLDCFGGFHKNFFQNAFLYWGKIRYKAQRWFGRYARTRYATAWLALFSFAEASFFPIAPDLFLIALLLVHRRWIYYSLITTFSSALGGVFGYGIGVLFFAIIGQPIISFYGLEAEMQRVGLLFSDNAFWTIFIAAFTPVPYKVFTIATGFFSVDIWIFFIASVLGRGLRFFLIGYFMKLYGKKLKYAIVTHFNILSLLSIPVILAYLFLMKIM